MAQIAVNPAQLRNAAKGLGDFVSPALSEQAQRLDGAYRIDPPGFGIALSLVEAEYNATIDYHLQNLRAAAESVNNVAAGLRQTAGNYDRAEETNVEMMSAGGAVPQADSWGEGWTDTGFARTFTAPLGGDGLDWGDTDQLVTMAAQAAALALAVSTGAMAPTYIPAPIAAGLLMFNGISAIDVGRELAAISTTMEGVAKEFDTYSTGATAGWEDESVVEYRNVITQMSRELSQLAKAVGAAASMLFAGVGLLGTFWLAFIAFSLPFFLTITELTLAAIGPQFVVLEPIIQSLGAIANLEWLAATGTVISVLVAAGALIFGVAKEWSAFQRFDEQGDRTPDFSQIDIAWHSA